MPGGRPTKYRKRYCQEIIDYFSSVKPFKESEISVKGKQFEKIEKKILYAGFPTFEEFAHRLGVHVDTLNQWAKDHKEFSQAYARAKSLQKVDLYTGGLSGVYNSNVVALIASHEHSIRLKQEHEISTPDDGSMGLTNLEMAAKLAYLINVAVERKKEQEQEQKQIADTGTKNS